MASSEAGIVRHLTQTSGELAKNSVISGLRRWWVMVCDRRRGGEDFVSGEWLRPHASWRMNFSKNERAAAGCGRCGGTLLSRWKAGRILNY